MEEVIKLLDQADQILRGKIKAGSLVAERIAYKEARELIQKALTVLLDIHL